MAKVFDESKCIVCGCTDSHACDGGCEWVSLAPPVCSNCIPRYLLAKLWAFVFAMESSARGDVAAAIRDLRRLYGWVTPDRASALGLPTLRQVCQINRKGKKFDEQHRRPPRRRRRQRS